MTTRVWDKGEPLDELVLRYTAGEDHALDDRLVAYDARASIAHVEMLREQSLLSDEDAGALREGLGTLASEHAAGKWRVALEEEDCHTALERRLIERLGDAGERVHLGRSRNDQVLAALRLYLRDRIAELASGADGIADELEALAMRDGAIALPGYTHMQRAMPSSVELWALGFASEVRDDASGIRAVSRRVEKNPLGSAAGYGTADLPIDRESTRVRLEFDALHEPVTAVQLSRGKGEAHLLFEITLLLQDLGRLAADLVLFATHEFGFVELPAEFTTGSSIMPQKRNPDLFELVRGRSAVAQGALFEVLAIFAKLTSGYHRDLQLLKAPLFRGIDGALDTIAIVRHALPGIRFREDRIELDPSLDAAARAYRLVVEEGVTFREAYRRVAKDLE